jgi:hypothetical protein
MKVKENIEEDAKKDFEKLEKYKNKMAKKDKTIIELKRDQKKQIRAKSQRMQTRIDHA